MLATFYAKAVDAISSGEPFMGQTELDGYGRVLWLTKDVWPNFISCVLAVHEDMIKNDRETVLDQPYSAARQTPFGMRAYTATAQEVTSKFGAALASQPQHTFLTPIEAIYRLNCPEMTQRVA